MIRIRRKGLSLSITGHAGAGKPGEDLVCAAVSALAWTLAANLEALKEAGGAAGVFIRISPADCRFRLRPAPGREREGALVFGAVALGLKALAGQYRSWIRWEEETGKEINQ